MYLRIRIFLTFGNRKNLVPHRSKLRTVARSIDVRHNIAAVRRTYLVKITVFRDVQLGAVGSKSGTETCRDPRRK